MGERSCDSEALKALVRASRRRQGLPEHVEDAGLLRRVAALTASRERGEEGDHETRPAA